MSAWDTQQGYDFIAVVPQLLQEMLQQQKKQNDLLSRMIGDGVDTQYELSAPSEKPAEAHITTSFDMADQKTPISIQMLDFVNARVTWFDDTVCTMEWDGGVDAEGDDFLYKVDWIVDTSMLSERHESFSFSKVYSDDTVFVQLRVKEKAAIIGKMMELIQNENGGVVNG